MKIAVIGAGLAGLSAAWLLGRQAGCEVVLHERQAQPGFTASSVSLQGPGWGDGARVDVPLRVYYRGYYPTLTRLYEQLGVASDPVSYAASFLDARGELYFRYRNLRVGARSWSLPAWPDLLQPGTRAIVADALRFYRRAALARETGTFGGLTVAQWAVREGLSGAFVEGLLLPAICTICTCPTALARELPAAVAAGYLLRGLSHEAVRRARHGADDVQARLLAGIPVRRLGLAIESVWREGARVLVRDARGESAGYDHVVFATPAPHALRLLADSSAAEAQALAGFRTTAVEVVTHGDPSCMPARQRDWSGVTLRVDPAREAPESTIWINAVQPALRGAPDVFQTVAPHRAPRADTVLGQARFERPVVDARSQAALAALLRLHEAPDRRVWFCGAWAQEGVPLLESAVRSAVEVARRLGAPFPATPILPPAHERASCPRHP
jgi:predicted NAD/FAD-binding protein